MEFNFNINNLLADVITKLDSGIKPARRNADGYDAQGLQNLLITVIDKMGVASAKAQGLPCVITSGRKLQYSDHILYMMKDPSGNNGRGTVVGILKIGHKKLFVYNHHGNVHEMEPLCVLDFYVHESRQRMGCGRKLFDFMLQDQCCLPQHLAIDKPSFKFSQFLAKHYHLRAVVPQVNNFVIFEGFFSNRPDHGVKRRPGLLGRPPSHPNKRREHEEFLHRQNTYNGYGLPPLPPRIGGSGSSIRSRPSSGETVDYQRNGHLRPISATEADEPGSSRKVGGTNSVAEQGRQMYSRLNNYGNTDSTQLIRPSPPLDRPSSKTIGNINRGNLNQNAFSRNPTPPGFPRNDSDSPSVQRNESRLLQRNDSAELRRRNNSAELTRKNDSGELLRRRTPVLNRNGMAEDYLQNINHHHDYQGRRGHMRVNPMVEDKQVRNPFLPKEEDRVVHPGWRTPSDQSSWTVFNRDPGFLSIAARNYSHTRLW